MSGATFWEKMLDFFAPVTLTMQTVKPYDPLLGAFLVGLIAYVLIRGQWRHELLRMETEALVRRYMIFRGKRHGSLGKIRVQKGTSKKVLKSVSRSWHTFKEYYVEQRRRLERNYREMKICFIVGCIFLVLNTLREAIAGLVIAQGPSGFVAGLLQSLPSYLFVVVGIFLLHLQKGEVAGTPPQQIDPALEAVFANFDVEDPRLSEEFDPLDREEEGD
jgi:hypothetical protein